jgi:hypothetical protein
MLFSTKKSINKMKKIIFGLFAVTLLVLSSCSSYLDVNTTPNVPVKVEAYALLPSCIQRMGEGIQFDARYVGKYTQNFVAYSGGDLWDGHGYLSGSDAGGQIFRNHYFGIGKNIDLIIEDALPKGKNSYVGIAYAIRAWSWLTLTDHQGECILKQAWDQTRTSFDYDKQEEIYAHVRNLCDTALIYLNQTSAPDANIAAADYMYRGNLDRWKKFVNGVAARSYAHLTNKANYNPDKVITYCDAAMASPSDDAYISFDATSLSAAMNFFGPTRDNFRSFRQSSYIAGLLTGTNTTFNGVLDPRASVILTPSLDGKVRGLDPHKGQLTVADSVRIPTFYGALNLTVLVKNRYLFGDNAPVPMMTYSEMQFLKAEALYRKGDKPGALAAYKNGISGSVDMCNYVAGIAASPTVSAANKAALLANTAVVPTTGASLTLNMILLQKYISDWGWNYVETWTDLRRYHYGVDTYNGEAVYTGFTLPTSAQYYVDNSNKPVYRMRPRYNSEYVWNLPSLKTIGGDRIDYHTIETWVTQK